MRSLNQKGQVVIFFILVIPIVVLLLVVTVQFSKLVFTKMKLQGALDTSVYAGASYLTEVLNQIALLNWDAHEKFLHVKQYFKINSKPSEAEAKRQVKNLWEEQNRLYDEIDQLRQNAYTKAYGIANEVFGEYFPKASLIPLYQSNLVLWDGPRVDFSFDKVNGTVVFDPTGHKKIPKTDLEARMAFVKDPSQTLAFAAGAQVEGFSHLLKAVAAAQPFGGSIWNFALSPDKSDSLLYQSAMVPLETLPQNGFIKTYEVHH